MQDATSSGNQETPPQTPVRRSSRAKVKHNYSELNDGIQEASATKELIVIDYVKMLGKARCTISDEVPRRILGEDLTVEYLSENGFREPLIVDSPDNLGVKMPPSSITVRRIEEIVGERLLDVIEVSTQSEVVPKWSLKKWADYYHTPVEERKGIYNVISLEVSHTPLMEQIQSPDIVRKLDWIDTVWPPQLKAKRKYPQVQHYCLMSVQNAYTDFHIDFAGSSVWYHVLKGEKVFYLIPPTPKHLQKYQHWSSSHRQNKVFFGNQVEQCFEARVSPGETLFIPTGWIHAVFTPVDSLVIGGNFLHGYNCRLQLEIYNIETSTQVPHKFRFPYFRVLMWYAAARYNELLKAGHHLNSFEEDSAKALVEALRIWLDSGSLESKKDIPSYIRPGLLLRELSSSLYDRSPSILKLTLKKDGDVLKSITNDYSHNDYTNNNNYNYNYNNNNNNYSNKHDNSYNMGLDGLDLMVSAAEHVKEENGDSNGNKRRFEINGILNDDENGDYSDEEGTGQRTKASLSFIMNEPLQSEEEFYLSGDDEYDEIDDATLQALNDKGDEEWQFVYMRKNGDNVTLKKNPSHSARTKKDPKRMGVRERLTHKLTKMEKKRKY